MRIYEFTGSLQQYSTILSHARVARMKTAGPDLANFKDLTALFTLADLAEYFSQSRKAANFFSRRSR